MSVLNSSPKVYCCNFVMLRSLIYRGLSFWLVYSQDWEIFPTVLSKLTNRTVSSCCLSREFGRLVQMKMENIADSYLYFATKPTNPTEFQEQQPMSMNQSFLPGPCSYSEDPHL